MSDRSTSSGGAKGRAIAGNPLGRFEKLEIVYDDPTAGPGPATELFRESSRRALSRNDSPDVPFEFSLNPYRGCEHGCSYCYARPTHEYLGFSAGLDFESRIVVKENAPQLLRRELAAPGWRPQVIALSGVTDAYQPVERRLEITRRCLEVLAEFRNPVSVVTKNHLVTRDADLLADLAASQSASVVLSITTLDVDLARRMEPRASHPDRRLAAIERLAGAGVPVGVNVAPVVPGLTDHEIPRILAAAASAGAGFAAYLMLRLPHGVKEIFLDWLEGWSSERRRRVEARVRDVRGGRLHDSQFGRRSRGTGAYADQIAGLFEVARRREKLARSGPPLSADAFVRPGQQSLFETRPHRSNVPTMGRAKRGTTPVGKRG